MGVNDTGHEWDDFPPATVRRPIGTNFAVHAEPRVRIEDCSLFGDVYFGFATYMNAGMVRSKSEVGRYCSLGRRVTVGLAHHDLSSITTSPFFDLPAPAGTLRLASQDPVRRVIVGNDCWIGDGAQIMSGVRVGDGAIIGASAVVTKDVPPYAIVGGIPAKIIKYRFPDDVIERLQALRWWRFSPAQLKDLFTVDVKESLDRLEAALPNLVEVPTRYTRVPDSSTRA